MDSAVIIWKISMMSSLLSECEQWNQKSWKEAERMTPRFFERIDVFRGYQLKYHIVSEVKQFLPVTMINDNSGKTIPSRITQ